MLYVICRTTFKSSHFFMNRKNYSRGGNPSGREGGKNRKESFSRGNAPIRNQHGKSENDNSQGKP